MKNMMTEVERQPEIYNFYNKIIMKIEANNCLFALFFYKNIIKKTSDGE